MADAERLTCAQTAVLVRAELGRRFPDARLVRFGADFAMCQRDYSDAFRDWVWGELRDRSADSAVSEDFYRCAETIWWPRPGGTGA